jgi:ribosomal protein S18 acetylase RimI-like enzyme
MTYVIQEMSISHYEPVMVLWRTTDGVHLSSIDSKENIERLLKRNPGLSFVALDQGKVVGAVLGSQDGRLGYLTHLAVDTGHRRQGIGRSLTGRCLYALMSMGVHKCALMIMEDNHEAIAFFKKVGLPGRIDLLLMAAQSD